jgi:hypothetical protein
MMLETFHAGRWLLRSGLEGQKGKRWLRKTLRVFCEEMCLLLINSSLSTKLHSTRFMDQSIPPTSHPVL